MEERKKGGIMEMPVKTERKKRDKQWIKDQDSKTPGLERMKYKSSFKTGRKEGWRKTWLRLMMEGKETEKI